MIWENFKDWVQKSWTEHPLYTLMFGAACFVAGGFIL